MHLDTKQRGVVAKILNGEVSSMFLTGEAGSGKSAIIKAIQKEARPLGKRVLVLAPTNAAAKNIGGSTVHKAFGLNLVAFSSKFRLLNGIYCPDLKFTVKSSSTFS